ncbi:MAG TPA: glycosyltransferase family 4 protein [Pseudoxanthomonas sp.]|jgi:glycosyltransferase involved in cell wall biosynthesis|nr:glycosyltransferase family 4 protein [Pseudoxanthomonas sp.]
MKFLFVGSSPDHGGAEVHFTALAQALQGAGHPVQAMVDPRGYIAAELARADVPLHLRRFRNVVDPCAHLRLNRAIRAFRPDALIGNFGKDYWPLLLAGRMANVPVALFRHSVTALNGVSRRWLPRLAHSYFAVSHYARGVYADHGMDTQCVQVLHNPVDLQRFRYAAQTRAQVLAALGIPQDAIVVGYCGRMLRSKGIYTLLEATALAMERDPRVHCLWVGEDGSGDLRNAAAAQTHGHRHHFTGLVDDTERYYSAFSMLAFPSLAPETFGRVSIEAQACGIPVLGSDIGGVPETLLPGSSGLLLPPGDARAWKRAILSLCDPAARAAMASAGRTFVEQRFSYPVIASQLVARMQASG